jgi:SAM-dependent methyltransferase
MCASLSPQPVPTAAPAAAPPSATIGPVADLFSSYVAASAISAAVELGLFDTLADGGTSPADDLRRGGEPLSPSVARALLNALAWAGIVELDTSDPALLVRPGPRFADAYELRGYFYWLVRGNGEVFTYAADLAPDRDEVTYHRDMRAVALSSRLMGNGEVEPLFDRVLAGLEFTRVADLGCGSGGRLVRIMKRNPGVTGVGIDLAPASVELAGQVIAAEGLADRLSVRQGDVHRLTPADDLSDVDVVTCVFMGHDFWPRESCVRVLTNLRIAFPNLRTMLLCDVVRSEDTPGPDTPIFRLGFEAAHALMHTYLPTEAEWVEAFAEAGWTPRAAHHTTSPPGGVLFELVPVAPARTTSMDVAQAATETVSAAR